MEANGNNATIPVEEASGTNGSVWVHKFKHMYCGLHFEVLSWHPDWPIKCCPECAGAEGFMQWSQEIPGFIFQYVPGSTPMVALVLGEESKNV